jgi:predicted Zn-ribbon and HTH transcriptional regulator
MDGTGDSTRAAAPRLATETPRQAIRRLLAGGPRTAYELSALIGLREKDVAPHVEHLARSLEHGDERLTVEPAHCLDCSYVFRDRQKLARPSACPKCRGQHLAAPVFSIIRTPGRRSR